MIINHNITALNTHRQMSSANSAQANSMEKLSSGLRINSAKDDAAGLSISEKMRGQIRGLEQGSRNAQDGISMLQTAEGALNETHDILQRMRELAVQSSNDTNTDTDRGELQKELDQLANEVDRIANSTEFNTQKLLDGSKNGLVSQSDGSATIQNNSSIAGLTAVVAAQDATDNINVNGAITITRTDSTDDSLAADFEIANPGSLAITAGTALENITVNNVAVSFADAEGNAIANLSGMKVGESITISFKPYEAGSENVESAISLQIGANSGQNLLVGINDMGSSALGVRSAAGDAIDISGASEATAAITTINNAIETVSAERSKLGSTQNRLEHTINNLNTSAENLTSAESRIRDVDYAEAA